MKILQTGMFVGIGENYPGWIGTVDTQVTYTPFFWTFRIYFFKRGELHIGDMAILIYLGI